MNTFFVRYFIITVHCALLEQFVSINWLYCIFQKQCFFFNKKYFSFFAQFYIFNKFLPEHLQDGDSADD